MSVGSIQPLCSMLTVQDARMVGVTLEGLDNILKVGKKNALDGVNPYAAEVEEAYGGLSIMQVPYVLHSHCRKAY